jgi:p-aminobenzoyl-glutamate transporter AbgT
MVGGCPGTLASSTTKTGRHDIAEILLKVALKAINQSINLIFGITNIIFSGINLMPHSAGYEETTNV